MTRQSDTRMRVVDALETLLKTHALENVRIGDLCRMSNISRTTFTSTLRTSMPLRSGAGMICAAVRSTASIPT